MELRHLRYFSAVGETLNVTRAAERLNVAQPALSQQIKMLEAEIGAPLLQRVGRGIALTAAGRRFLEAANVILSQSDAAILSARQAARGDVGRLAIGLTESAGFSPHITEPILHFRRTYPEVDLTITEGRSEDLARALADRTIDVALLRPPVPDEANCAILPVHSERLVAAIPRDHRLARRKRIALKDLGGETLIWPRRRASGGGISQALFTALAESGVVLANTMETAEFATAVNMAAIGLGVALVPESLRGLRSDAVIFASLTAKIDLVTETLLVAPTDLQSPTARNFQAMFAAPR